MMTSKAFLWVSCGVACVTLSGSACLADTVTVISALQSLKWGALAFAVPGIGWAVACGVIGAAWTVAGTAASLADVDPPVIGVPKIAYVATYPSGEKVTSVRPYDIIQIVGVGSVEFEFIPSQNKVFLGTDETVAPIFASTQGTLVVAVPRNCPLGEIELAVENSLGKSSAFMLSVTDLRESSGSRDAARRPGDLAYDYGVVTREFFDTFETLTGKCAEFEGKELPDFDQVGKAFDVYFASLAAASEQELAEIERIILQGELDIIDATAASTMELDCPDVVIPTVPEWGLIVMTVLLMTGGAVLFGRRRRPAAA